jgi:hypothetical protein
MLYIFLDSVRSSREWEFTWHRLGKYASELLEEASPHAVVLVLPYIQWDLLKYREDWVRRWAWAVSAAPDNERAARSVVDTLLQIASKEELLPHIPVNVWSWLTRRPHLPAVCLGRNVGTCAHVVKAVRALGDIEILKSYFLLVWSEWNHFSPDGSNSLGHPLPLGSTPIQTPVYVHPVHVAGSLLSHDTLSSSDSIPDRPPSQVLDSASSHHPPRSSDNILSHRTPDSTNNLSVHPPLPGSTLDHHLSYVADSTSSRRISISSDSTPSSPPLHVIPISMPIRYSSPIPISTIPILHPSILQLPILDQSPVPVGVQIRHSSNGSNSTVSHHTPNSPNSVLDHRPLAPDSTSSPHPAYVAGSMSSHHTSVRSTSTPGSPLHPINVRVPQPLMQPQPPLIGPPFDAVTPGTPSVRTLNIRDDLWIPRPMTISPPPSKIVPINQPVDVARCYTLPRKFQDDTWIAQPPTQPPPIGPEYFITVVPPSRPGSSAFSSGLWPPHIANNMPSSQLSGGFYEMQISIQQDFGGIGMEHHRADLLQQLDHVIGRLDHGLGYLKQHDPEFNEAHLQRTKHQYQYLREILLEANIASDHPYVSFNDHAVPSAHSRSGCTQDLAQRFCGSLSRTLSLTGRIPGTHTSYFVHTSAVVSRPPLYTRLSTHVLVGYNFSLDVDVSAQYFVYSPSIGVGEE